MTMRKGNKQNKQKWCSSYSLASTTADGSSSSSSAGDSPRNFYSSEFHARPDTVLHDLSLRYVHVPLAANDDFSVDGQLLLQNTPLPKGSSSFTSVHLVAVQEPAAEARADRLQESLEVKCGKAVSRYSWPAIQDGDVVGEYNAIFGVASDLILKGADRSSLLVFVSAAGSSTEMAVASLLGMLPFRGIQVAFLSPKADAYVNPLQQRLQTASGLFEYDAPQAERMGKSALAAVFGPLADHSFTAPLSAWEPLKPSPLVGVEQPAPFKIGALELPMVTFAGKYADGVQRLAALLSMHYGESLFPIVACGETVDALGYGSDILAALEERSLRGFYFTHRSGESFKCYDAYGKPELLQAIAEAKRAQKRIVIVTVGGGVNGNTMGVIAAMTGAALVEVPTTLMHYNDATTSAKKAFSLVVDGQILSKNILGTFYLPQLVYCISETFLTLSSSSIHAAVGEATKTMSMLGNACSKVGQKDFHNILGAVEFAKDFTRIIKKVDGFEHLINFVSETRDLKLEALKAGKAIRLQHASDSGLDSKEMDSLLARRNDALQRLRSNFRETLPAASREDILGFLTVINEEIIAAKAMFLAYSDPFEKYRALLFEYAHTLGHGVEAFMNGLYRRAEALGIDYNEAFRLHGQCVGMAVLWAGEMSRELGHLFGNGYKAHQALVYLFNRFGGFDFGPLRRLCDELGVSRDEFCEGVLKVVRRDNKRGYCKCAAGSSVDQLVRRRPGCLLRSSDPSAELRYLVEVSEESQRAVLEKAFEGAYDRVLLVNSVQSQDFSNGEKELSFVLRSDFNEMRRTSHASTSIATASQAAEALDGLIRCLYEDDTSSSGGD
mmetsp:Transcript_14410/g.34009  ORF Transcript_14410/g.34009 Transcript_14410/m.34009 type:complete len:838 (-) Transcript_14410:214-2727(-)